MNVENQNWYDEHVILSSIYHGGADAFIDVSDLINESHFSALLNKFIYSSYDILFNQKQDFTVANIISTCLNQGINEKDIGTIEQILNHHYDISNVRKFATKLKNKRLIKDAVQILRSNIQNLNNLSGGENTSEIFGVIESSIFDLIAKHSYDQTQNPQLYGEVAEEIVREWAENPSDNMGVPTPWDQYNESIGGGIRPGYVYLVGARSGVGKTSVGLNTGLYLTNNEIPTLFLDSEMTLKDTLPRILASISGVKIRHIESGMFANNDFEKQKIHNGLSALKSLKFFHKSVAGKPFDEILGIIRRWIYTEVGINDEGVANDCLVIYDYFKIMDSAEIDNMAEYQALGFQISKLTDFAKRYNFPCLSFVQLNRDGITKDTSDVISGSDRLLWGCAALTLFREKSAAELTNDGPENGNRVLYTIKSRFGYGELEGKKINMNAQFDVGLLQEMPRSISQPKANI